MTLPLLPDFEQAYGEWDCDSWETPANVARKMAGLVLPSDRTILEPAAGTGQIAQFLQAESVVCVELKRDRYRRGILTSRYKHGWLNKDFLKDEIPCPYGLVITNPPFSLGVEFIDRGLQLLDRSYEHARLLYLLPCDFFQSQGRAEAFQKLDCHIHHRYLIAGRVAYLKHGVAMSGRQMSDCVFDIRPGKAGATETYL